MERTEIVKLLNTISKLSQVNYDRMPTKVLMPTSYLDILFCRDDSPIGQDLKGYSKFGFNSYYGVYLDLEEDKSITKPRIIFKPI